MVLTPTTWQIEPGLLPYETAVSVMKERIAAIRAGTAEELLWLVEHPPLYTAGTSAVAADLQDASRFPTYQAGRGGQWTYHGPGQRVVYTMLDLQNGHGSVPARDVRSFVGGLEAWMIATLKDFGVKGETRAGRVGIWVVNGAEEQKIGAIGVRVSRWVTWHGMALNVHPDLSHFSGIIPCGIREHGVTSLAALGVDTDMATVDAALAQNFTKVFG
jgi:lipoyl(octanoyl) transferase